MAVLSIALEVGMMKRIVMSLALLVALSPVGIMAAREVPAKRPEVAQLKAKRKAFRAEVQAAKANGKISPEEKARLKAERAQLRREASALKLNRQFQAKKNRAGKANKI
jgi:hypothetical protein